MKKLKFICLSLITLFLVLFSFVFVPVKVFAVEETSEDWFNYVSQFDSGYARASVGDLEEFTSEFVILIEHESHYEFDGSYIKYDFSETVYFEPQLHQFLNYIYESRFSEAYQYLSSLNYKGYFFWNFEQQYWQIDYYNTSGFFGYLEEQGYNTYRYQFSEPEGLIIIDFYYPVAIFEGYEIPILIDLVSFPSNVGPVTIEGINFHNQHFDVSVTEFYNDTVDFFVDPSYYDDAIVLTVLEYTYMGTLKTKYLTTDMPVTVYSSEIDYYKFQIAYLNDEINNLNNQISELQDSLESEYDRGYDEGYDAGYEEGNLVGYNEGYQEGIMLNNEEAYQEGFKDGEKSQIAKNNESFYKGLEKWLVPAIITVILLGGFVTIAVRKRREE